MVVDSGLSSSVPGGNKKMTEGDERTSEYMPWHKSLKALLTESNFTYYT